MKTARSLLPALLVFSATAAAAAPSIEAHAPDWDAKRWGVGVQIAPLSTPRGHIGIPWFGESRMPLEIVARWQPTHRFALNAGLGLPHASLGSTFWVGGELFTRVAEAPHGLVALELYQSLALQLGFAGPDYYARHDGDFVGYSYVNQGAGTLALRLPAGVRLRWANGWLDTYAEGSPTVTLTPDFESLFALTVGVRVRF